VHDRRIDGETQVFGNAGALFMTAMTWYDHKTESIWSQPWGRAIIGELKGVQLNLLPSQITTWAAWRTEHPETLAMTNDVDRMSSLQRFDEDFIIGVLLEGKSKAFYYRDVSAVGVINDWVGDIPILVWAAENNFHVYIRRVADQELMFRIQDGEMVDAETGTIWDIGTGRAIDGPLVGEVLQAAPSSSAFDWAWQDFYPDSEFYQP